MTLYGLVFEPWVLRASAVCILAAALLALMLWNAVRRERERDEEKFRRRMRGGR